MGTNETEMAFPGHFRLLCLLAMLVTTGVCVAASNAPSESPTTFAPSNSPSYAPTPTPSDQHTPSKSPTTFAPSNAPSYVPTKGPTAPTYASTDAPTKAPTDPTNAPTAQTTATPTTFETVSQAVTISSLNSSDYSGTLKTNYEKGFGVAVDACTSPCSSYKSGIAISSSASRRTATVTFVMTLSGVDDTSAYTGGCSGTCTTTLASAISTATSTTVAVSTIADARVSTPAPTAAPTLLDTSSSSSNNAWWIAMLCVLVITIMGVAIGAFIWKAATSKNENEIQKPSQP